ncbi:MAG: hypothetical protein JXR31_03270 [Prolixibacteraceae bacterium]|nr:hypothetical protein [Prolixibacteraceae bacterium]
MKTINNLFDFWEEGNRELFKNNDSSNEMIIKIINRSSRSTSFYFGFNILFYSAFILACIILVSMNLPMYAGNPVVRSVLIAQMVLCILFLSYGMFMFAKFRETKNYRKSITELLAGQLRFYKTYNDGWMVFSALAVLILIFNLNIMVDYNNGIYPIYNKSLYIAINIAIFIFIYGIQKAGSLFNQRKLRNYLSDLESGLYGNTLKMEKQRKWQTVAFIVLFVVLTGVLILGILKSLESAN